MATPARTLLVVLAHGEYRELFSLWLHRNYVVACKVPSRDRPPMGSVGLVSGVLLPLCWVHPRSAIAIPLVRRLGNGVVVGVAGLAMGACLVIGKEKTSFVSLDVGAALGEKGRTGSAFHVLSLDEAQLATV